MITVEAALEQASDTQPFSNGFEWDCWSAHWCRCCAKDEWGTAPEGTSCPLLEVVFCHEKTPSQWTPGTDDLHDRYHCTEFEQGDQ